VSVYLRWFTGYYDFGFRVEDFTHGIHLGNGSSIQGVGLGVKGLENFESIGCRV
jgi:hypothetical protein